MVLALVCCSVAAEGEATKETVLVISQSTYVSAIIAAVLGSIVHFFKKIVKGETDSEIVTYLKDHKFQLVIGVVISIAMVFGEAAVIFKSGEGLWFSAFLTGYSADSVLGSYTPKASITMTSN
jgi:hypothetical protein